MSKKSAMFGNRMWERVHGANLCPQYIEVGKANKTVFESPSFKKACEKAGIPATKRQTSKFRRKMGLAYKCR